MGDEVEDVLLEVCAGRTDAVDFAFADEFRERKADPGRAHRAGDGKEHLAAPGQVVHIGLSSVENDGGVEMAVVAANEFLYRCHFCPPPPKGTAKAYARSRVRRKGRNSPSKA